MTGPKSISIAQIFTKSEPNTVWNKIYNDHMSNDSFISSDIEATNVLLQKNELLTQYSEVDIMKRYSKPCEIQILWVSPTKARASIAFQKVFITELAIKSNVRWVFP